MVQDSSPRPCVVGVAQSVELVSSSLQERRIIDVGNLGAASAAKRLKGNFQNNRERIKWLEQARINAIAGSCPRSHRSVISGLRCFMFFVLNALNTVDRIFPPRLYAL